MSSRFARNQARYRERRRDGQRIFSLALREDAVADLLVMTKIISVDQADDAGALRRGLEAFLKLQLDVIDNRSI